MANKALAKRQKMTMRTEPSQKSPRNPNGMRAALAAGTNGNSRGKVAPQDSLLQRLLKTKHPLG